MTFKTLKRTKKERQLILLSIANWLLETVNKWQFSLLSALILGIATQAFSQDMEAVQFFMLVLIMAHAFSRFSFDISNYLRALFQLVKGTIWYVVFMLGYSEISNEQVANSLLKAWVISASFYLIIRYVYPKLFRHYLFKKVLNKPYLAIRKEGDSLPPKDNFFEDVKLENATDRMQFINQKAIQTDYQNVIDLSFINSAKKTGLHYFTDVHTQETQREFADVDSNHLLVFKLYPFGFATPNASYFHWTLLKLELSQQEAFTRKVEGIQSLKLSSKGD
ncbi:hypothetical protein [Streptococcus sp. UBA4344]|uniref:hypothetical protein n=1 Tax=Streptococcus sp. UBA4344 TaxID=1947564 RepID=UPI00257A5197|nr:hypothetical protein [Streptococcus sp. UBA4344]